MSENYVIIDDVSGVVHFYEDDNSGLLVWGRNLGVAKRFLYEGTKKITDTGPGIAINVKDFHSQFKKKCLRCGHEWLPKSEKRPVTCAKCRSPYWDTPKKEKG